MKHANILVIDVGGTHVKLLATGHKTMREFASGAGLSAKNMVQGVRSIAKGWNYDAVSIGYPGVVVHGRPVKNVEALANPEALEHYRDRPELRT